MFVIVLNRVFRGSIRSFLNSCAHCFCFRWHTKRFPSSAGFIKIPNEQRPKKKKKIVTHNRAGNDEYMANSGENCFSACARFRNRSVYVVWETVQIVEFRSTLYRDWWSFKLLLPFKMLPLPYVRFSFHSKQLEGANNKNCARGSSYYFANARQMASNWLNIAVFNSATVRTYSNLAPILANKKKRKSFKEYK